MTLGEFALHDDDYIYFGHQPHAERICRVLAGEDGVRRLYFLRLPAWEQELAVAAHQAPRRWLS